MEKKNAYTSLIIFIIAIVIIGVLVANIFTKSDLVPEDYPEKIEKVSNNDTQIYVYSDKNYFEEVIEYIEVITYENIILNNNKDNILVIDMYKYNQHPFITEQQIEYLYNDLHFIIMIVNYHSSNSHKLEGIIDFRSLASDLINI